MPLPDTTMLPSVEAPVTPNAIPTFKFLATPTPPATVNAPFVGAVLCVVLVTVESPVMLAEARVARPDVVSVVKLPVLPLIALLVIGVLEIAPPVICALAVVKEVTEVAANVVAPDDASVVKLPVMLLIEPVVAGLIVTVPVPVGCKLIDRKSVV